MEVGVNYKDFWNMTILEVNIIVESHNNKIKETRQNLFTLANLISFAFHDPQHIPTYQDSFENKKTVLLDDNDLNTLLNEDRLKQYFNNKSKYL